MHQKSVKYTREEPTKKNTESYAQKTYDFRETDKNCMNDCESLLRTTIIYYYTISYRIYCTFLLQQFELFM